jgi:hypothetical protein
MRQGTLCEPMPREGSKQPDLFFCSLRVAAEAHLSAAMQQQLSPKNAAPAQAASIRFELNIVTEYIPDGRLGSFIAPEAFNDRYYRKIHEPWGA